jgi:biofilm PGA synthesis N-glycosyltransferase PgaC
MNYVVITPVRNEERYVGEAIRSVVAQTHRPLEWVIVDDGSRDKTTDLVRAAAQQHDWIKVVRRADRGFYMRGPGVVDAAQTGIAALSTADYDVLVKLDGDLRFGPDAFSKIMRALEENPRLGMVGGRLFETRFGFRIRDDSPSTTVLGATRCYRRACYQEIKGIDRAWGWDAIDEAKAQSLGWETCTLEDVEIDHLKVQNTRNWFEHGRSAYVMGSGPLYAATRSIWRMKYWPFGVVGCAFAVGYVVAWASRLDRAGTTEERAELRRQQRLRAGVRIRKFLRLSQRGLD